MFLSLSSSIAGLNPLAEFDFTIKFLVVSLFVAILVLFICAMTYSVRLHSQAKHEDINVLRNMKVSDDTLFPLLQPHLVPMEEIEKLGYSSVLSLVQILIGVRPTCDMVLQIWPPAFESYNLIVPNFLNLPEIILGVKGSLSAELCSIAMYASSRANECAYCTSHCCSFGIRRGADPKLFGDNSNRTPEQQAVATVAYGLGTVPCSLNHLHVQELNRTLSMEKIEWVIAAVAMFGSFNKLMDGLGIPLEPDTFAETVDVMDSKYSVNKAGSMLDQKKNKTKPLPPIDSWTTKLAVIYQGLRPGGALALDAKLMRDLGSVKDSGDCMLLLDYRVGHSFAEIIGKLKHTRVRCAVTAVVLKNLNEATSAGLGTQRKLWIGVECCAIVENPRLKLAFQNILKRRFGNEGIEADNSSFTQLALKVGEGLSYSPSRMSESLVQKIRECPDFSASMLVELVSFLATVQMLHRIEYFYHISSTIPYQQQ